MERGPLCEKTRGEGKERILRGLLTPVRANEALVVIPSPSWRRGPRSRAARTSGAHHGTGRRCRRIGIMSTIGRCAAWGYVWQGSGRRLDHNGLWDGTAAKLGQATGEEGKLLDDPLDLVVVTLRREGA